MKFWNPIMGYGRAVEYRYAEIAQASERIVDRGMRSDDAAQIMYTSGTTGKPKGAVLQHNGVIATGDMGRMDQEGYLYIVDRLRDMIITGGFNIYPKEIEDVLYSHPAVLEATVIGVPDAVKGEMAKAYVVFKDGAKATEEELDAFCRRHLAAYKVPRLYEFKDTPLPKNPQGKILKRVLRDEMKGKP